MTSRHLVAGAYQEAADIHRAIPLYERVLADQRRVPGDDHPHTLRSRNSVAACLRALGEIQAAREVDEGTLARRRRVLGDDHQQTLASARNLAGDLEQPGTRASLIRWPDRDRSACGTDHDCWALRPPVLGRAALTA